MKPSNNEQEKIIVFLVIFIMAIIVIAIYFLSKIFFAIGIVLLVAGTIILSIGLYKKNNLKVYGSVVLVLGVLLAVIGHTGISFFEQNNVGKNLLESSNTIVGAGAEIMDAVSVVKGSEARANEELEEAVSNLNEPAGE